MYAMVTGRNCLGSVLYPISASDAIMADVIDGALSSKIASFPSWYQSMAGDTGYRQYSLCFQAYMAMQCANAFPMCFAFTMMAREEFLPGLGRVPICINLVTDFLEKCPGSQISDLEEMAIISIPPICAYVVYSRMDLMPRQTVTQAFSDAREGKECPSVSAEALGGDGSEKVKARKRFPVFADEGSNYGAIALLLGIAGL